jgi:glyoxylase-like metal-dependent hydrolase (beta-lactamase superfamily II)
MRTILPPHRSSRLSKKKKPMEIFENVHLIKNHFVNLFLIVDAGYLTLIDTGISGNEKRILNYIKNLGFKPEAVNRIIITHADGDHYGSLARLQKVISAETLANQVEAEAIRTGSSSRKLNPVGIEKLLYNMVSPLVKSQPARVDQYLLHGQVFPILGGLQVINTPGHTPGHISLYSPSTRILFAGDSINVAGRKLVPSSGANTWDLHQAEQSFQIQVKLDPVIVCAGHGFWKK